MALRARGVRQTRIALRNFPRALALTVHGEMAFAVAKRIENKAKQTRAFIDRSGRLRQSIRTIRIPKVYQTPTGPVRTPRGAAAVGSDVFYAPFVEFGHGGPAPARPHPFLGPAERSVRREALNIAAREGRRLLPQAVRRARGTSG